MSVYSDYQLSSLVDQIFERLRAARLGAIKKYRELTDAGLDEAKEVVAGL